MIQWIGTFIAELNLLKISKYAIIYVNIVKEQNKRKFMTQSHRSKSINAYDS